MSEGRNKRRTTRHLKFAAGLFASVLIASPSAAQPVSFFGPIRNGERHFTAFPEYIGIGMSQGETKKRDVVYSTIQMLAITAGIEVRAQPGLGRNTIGVIFRKDVVQDGRVDVSKIQDFGFDPYYEKLLNDTAATGAGNCASAVNYSAEGRFERAVVVANSDVPDQELATCVAQAQAHALGIGTFNSSKADFSRFIARIMILVDQKKRCLQDNQTKLTCKFVDEPWD
ncbi:MULTISPECIES: hypothetical protein [unclassified Ensifer]|uniref:hypothetical protein n=1 Tax=unclassified Ensifer TaxID=2633371 RepID=UPI000812EE31|nr:MULTISPECIES: hypothetical protein [unclassified Ensifer]OCP02890.1 hypothetical protein BBX50_27315 [Ensifer sp. LC11]OCP02937.1 hypothetical protein BC362_18360 [Ensifer sp. LC14]OCP03348.1 hypothetical protein BC374_27365 [Ensifer sp. LC13]OCP29953.1 hypothetical protein BC364_27430 [Ensifer sp. LC499]